MATRSEPLRDPSSCPHRTLVEHEGRMRCGICATPWLLVRDADNSDAPTLFGGAA